MQFFKSDGSNQIVNSGGYSGAHTAYTFTIPSNVDFVGFESSSRTGCGGFASFTYPGLRLYYRPKTCGDAYTLDLSTING